MSKNIGGEGGGEEKARAEVGHHHRQGGGGGGDDDDDVPGLHLHSQLKGSHHHDSEQAGTEFSIPNTNLPSLHLWKQSSTFQQQFVLRKQQPCVWSGLRRGKFPKKAWKR